MNASPADPQHDPFPRRRRRWLLEGCLLILVLVLVHLWQSRHLVTGPAPDFQGQLLSGQTVSLSELRGQPVLLQFWATWCPVCRVEQGSIDRIARRYRVLTVALDDADAAHIQQWLLDRGVSYPVVTDPGGHIAGLFGVRGVPTSIIIDAEGMIRSVSVGYTTEAGLRARLWWARISARR